MVWRDPDGKPKVQQATSLVGPGAWGGAFWGMLLGLLFFAPWLGLAIGAVTGALAGKFADIGIDDTFIRDVEQKITPGTSALFLLVRRATLDRVLAALQPYHPEVLQTSLSAEQEARLREAFGGAPEGEAAPAPRPRAGGARHRRLSPVTVRGGPAARGRLRRNGGGTVRGASGSRPVPACSSGEPGLRRP